MKLAIFGSGGHASEIADICENIGCTEIVFILPDNAKVDEQESNGVAVESETVKLFNKGFMFAIGVSEGAVREKIYRKYPLLPYPNLIHKSVSFGRGLEGTLASRKGVIIAAGARFMSAVDIGDFSTYGLNCTIGHNSHIAPYVSIMPGANISGYVCLDKYTYVGAGATIIQGTRDCPLRISKSTVVGAGCVVTKSFYKASKLVGVPARDINDR